MYKKLLLALAASLSIALSGCGGLAGLLGVAAGVAANRDTLKYNDAVDFLDRAIVAMNAAGRTGTSTMQAAVNSPTRSSVTAARNANNAFFEASKTAEAAARRAHSLGQSAGVDNAYLQRIAEAVRDASENVSEARSRNSQLNGYGFGQAMIGGGSGAGIYDVGYPPDILKTTAYAYDVRNGTISAHRIEGTQLRNRSYTDGEGNQFRISLSGDPDNGDGTYAWHFVNGRPNSGAGYQNWNGFSSRGTNNGVPLFIDTHDHSGTGETHRTLLAAGRYSAAAVTGHYDPTSRRGASEDIYAVSYGNYTVASRLPRINATFRGAMVGTELLSRAALEGETRITYSSASNDLDIRLHNIRQYDDGEVQATAYGGPSAFEWNNVSVTEDGAFLESDRSKGFLFGDFHGPNGEEIAAAFERDIPNNGKVVGAFVAKQQ